MPHIRLINEFQEIIASTFTHMPHLPIQALDLPPVPHWNPTAPATTLTQAPATNITENFFLPPPPNWDPSAPATILTTNNTTQTFFLPPPPVPMYTPYNPSAAL